GQHSTAGDAADAASRHDVITDSESAAKANGQANHGNSHASSHEAVTAADVNFGLDGHSGGNPHDTVTVASEVDPGAPVAHLSPKAEASLHVEDTPASTIVDSIPAAQRSIAGNSSALEVASRDDAITGSEPAS